MGTQQSEILMIEDDATLGSALGVLLRAAGYSVAMAPNPVDGLKMATECAFDLILLDLAPSDSDAFSVCRDLRQAGTATPILILAASTQIADIPLWLKQGADDCITKPFDIAELLARIEALLRRVHARLQRTRQPAGAIRIDMRRTCVVRNGRPVSMTMHEFQLLLYLVKRSGRCVSRGELLKTVWGYSSDSATRTIDMHIASLRKKLEADPKAPKLILTVPKVGYVFVGSSGVYQRR